MFKKKEEEKTKKYQKIDLTPQQMFYTNALSIEALINVLEKKGILSKEEVLDEIREMGNEREMKMEELNEDIKKG
ncbi:MAG: hypothetical protein SVK54_07030 [candidate division WOR-3 bacterium]|nr:hypothetical protein [candidate division WOR-3 bacterium]